MPREGVFAHHRIMSHIDVAITDVQVVVRATCPSFCKCDGGSCHGEKCRCVRSCTVAPGFVRMVAGSFFIQLSRRNTSLRRLMCCLAIADNTEDNESFAILGNVTVLDDLATEREMATRMLVTGGSRSAVAKLNSRWHRNKKWRNKMAAVPDVIEVTTPAVGTVPQCTVRMLSEARQHKPGFAPACMEITGESLT